MQIQNELFPFTKKLEPTKLYPFLLLVDDFPVKLYSDYEVLMRKAEDLMESGHQCSVQTYGAELVEDL